MVRPSQCFGRQGSRLSYVELVTTLCSLTRHLMIHKTVCEPCRVPTLEARLMIESVLRSIVDLESGLTEQLWLTRTSHDAFARV